MDLNELHFRHQIALMRAGSTASRSEHSLQAQAAGIIASRIGLIQQRGGALAAPLLAATGWSLAA